MNFFQEWGIKHQVTPPHFPRANGQTVKNSLTKAAEEGKDLYVVLLDYMIQPAKDMPSPAELLMERKLRTFLKSHPGQLKPTFDVERAREALRKGRSFKTNMLTSMQQCCLCYIKMLTRNRFLIRQDNTENDNPRWSRTVEDLYNSDATEISRIPNDSADGQINASPKTKRSNINQRLQVPIETVSDQSNPVVRKSSRKIVKPVCVRYRDN
ncbi:integrase catalytic domain-containing protein [Trichonephila clavipes]|nr:integrase catalytic domain-containing protein [Trichonephila clavipes]